MLGKENIRQRLKPLFLCNGRPRAALLLKGCIQVLDLDQGRCGVYRLFKLLGELALLGNGGLDRLPPLGKATQIRKALFERAQRGVVHRTVQLLAVACDKGDGVALVDELYHIFDVLGLFAELIGKNFYNVVHMLILSESTTDYTTPRPQLPLANFIGTQEATPCVCGS